MPLFLQVAIVEVQTIGLFRIGQPNRVQKCPSGSPGAPVPAKHEKQVSTSVIIFNEDLLSMWPSILIKRS